MSYHMYSLKTLLYKNHQAKRLSYLIVIYALVCLFMLYSSRSTNSLAITAYSNLLVFDVFTLLTALLSIWVKLQPSSSAYPYGFKRFEVLAIFSSTILIILGSFFIIKESVETLFEEKKQVDISGLFFPASLFGLMAHLFQILVLRNDSFDYVIKSSASSWLQEHMLDLSEGACRFVPGLSKLLLPRINPFILIGFANFSVVFGTYLLIGMGCDHLVDTYAGIFIAIMTMSTMMPFTIYTGKILLQTTPAHLVAQLDKSLREASTLDGVLEFRDEHFWTVSFGVLAGSLHVRIRRDADEQLVLAHVWYKLAGLVQVLTIHIFKDDWMRRTTHQLVYNQPPIVIPPQMPFQQSNNRTSQLTTSFLRSPASVSSVASTNNSDSDYVIVNP